MTETNDCALLELRGVCKSYEGTRVLEGLDLKVASREVHAVMGPSGSGKSTMLRLIALLEAQDRGEILLDGQLLGSKEPEGRRFSEAKLAEQRRDIGTVFQRFNLFPHMTALENVASGLRIVGRVGRSEAHERAQAMLEQVSLGPKSRAFPAELSGGQQQRVAIARALVMEPRVMLFDEATASLDPELVAEVLATMEDLARGGMTMIVVTHEARFARGVADVVHMFDGGRILESLPPEQFFSNPTHERTARFLSSLS